MCYWFFLWLKYMKTENYNWFFIIKIISNMSDKETVIIVYHNRRNYPASTTIWNTYVWKTSLWMSERRLLYVINVWKTSFLVWNVSETSFVRLRMSQKRLFHVIDVSIKRYWYLSQRSLLYVMNVSKTS